MRRKQSRAVWIRLIGVTASILVVVSGVTFAALQSPPVKLTGNTIETATAGLQISTDGTNFAAAQNGFDFNNVVPGTSAQGSSSFTLKNNGTTSVGLRFSVSSVPTNPAELDLSKVNVILVPTSTSQPQSFSLAALIAANASSGLAINTPAQLAVGAKAQYTIQVTMASDAISGSSASLGNLEFAFSGVAGS